MSGPVVLVTGAGRGVGRGIVEALLDDGGSVVAAVHHVADAGPLEEAGGKRLAAPRCDVTVRADVEAAVEVAGDRFGRLDAVIHNAVSNRSNETPAFESATAELWDEHAAVSIRALLYIAQASHAALAASRGSLLILTSPAGIQGTPDRTFYSVVKGAQRGFVKALAREWGLEGIRVNGLAPLAMTPALEKAFAADPAMEPRLSRLVPLRRFGDPATDIGPAAAFLCSEAARYVTGQTLVVSGGRFTAL